MYKLFPQRQKRKKSMCWNFFSIISDFNDEKISVHIFFSGLKLWMEFIARGYFLFISFLQLAGSSEQWEMRK